ncbi:MAG: 16S rRNA processing protein RimM [Marinilabiliales bacterium]|nr:MAG: 16S rRNA processing protein RimM [Marinilabiliales bacterium]
MKDELISLGILIKPHGIKGEFLLKTEIDNPEIIEEMELVFLETEGFQVPFFIDHDFLRITKDNQVIIKFDEINDEISAKEFQGSNVLIEANFIEKEEISHPDIQGYTIIDEKIGQIGTVKELILLPNNPVLAVDYQNNEVLIPMAEEIIIHIDNANQVITSRIPDGLLEI